MDCPVHYFLSITDLEHDTIHEHDGIDAIKGSGPLPPDIIHDALCDVANQRGRNVNVIHLLDSCRNLSGGHALAV